MKKNIGVIGCGDWGKNLVRNFYKLNSLCAICDIDGKTLNSFQEKYPDLAFYKDYKICVIVELNLTYQIHLNLKKLQNVVNVEGNIGKIC